MNDRTYIGWWLLGFDGTIDTSFQYPGQLVIDEGNIGRLQLLGIAEDDRDLIHRLQAKDGKILITGITTNSSTKGGSKISLLNCRFQGLTMSGIFAFTLESSLILIGHNLHAIRTFKIGKVKLRPKFLEDWIAITGHEQPLVKFEGGFSVDHSYQVPKPILLLKNNSMRIRVEFEGKLKGRSFSNSYQITERAFVSISFQKTKTLKYVWHLLDKLSNFFTLAIGEAVPLKDLEFGLFTRAEMRKQELKSNTMISVVRPEERKIGNSKNVNKDQMPLSYAFIERNSNSILHKWMSTYEDYKPALNLYFGKIYSKGQYVENAFLDIVFAIEVFHRLLTPNFNGKSEKYREKLDGILKKHHANERNWLIRRLGNKSEKTLINRFNDILTKYASIANEIFRKPEQAIERVVTTRNYLVHYSIPDELRKLVIPTRNLHVYTDKLTVLFQAILIQHLIEDPDLVKQQYGKSTLNKLILQENETPHNMG